MSKQQDMHYKERTPAATVEYLCGLLKDMGITMEEQWLPRSSIGTYSLRINIAGTKIGTNGKGISEEYARASAYAEFFERFQNLLLDPCSAISDESMGFRHYHDEKYMSSLEIAALDNAFLNMLYDKLGVDKNAPLLVKKTVLQRVDQVEKFCSGLKDMREVRPYYNVTKKQLEWMLSSLSLTHYGSNGMCAGNSPEEALCQGFSEIFERYVQKKMIQEQLCFPNIPDDEIARYPKVWAVYKKAQEISGFKVILKDCSMGGKFPVAALFVIQADTGRFGIKFGSHPDFGIAMERTLTEATQGRDLQDYGIECMLDFKNSSASDSINVYNTFKFGVGTYPYQSFGSTPDYEYVRVADVSEKTNHEILQHMIAITEAEGYEVWIRDVSYTGFPSYHILVPGMAEIFDAADIHLRASNSRAYLIPYINDLATIDKKICRMLVGVIEFWSTSQIDNQMRMIFGFGNKRTYPGEEIGYGWLYLVAMGYAFMDDYKTAALRMSNLVLAAEWLRKSQPKLINAEQCALYSSIHQYLTARSVLGTHKSAMQQLENIYSTKMAQHIDHLFGEPDKILTKQYPKNEFSDTDAGTKEDFSDYFRLIELNNKLKQRQIKHPISQEDIQNLIHPLGSLPL